MDQSPNALRRSGLYDISTRSPREQGVLRSAPVKWVRGKLSERQWRLVRLWGPVAAGALLLLIVLAVWLPALAERRIRQRLAPLDLDFRASIGLSLSGAVLRDVEVLTKSGQRLLQARRVEADVSFWHGELRGVSSRRPRSRWSWSGCACGDNSAPRAAPATRASPRSPLARRASYQG